MELHPNSKFLDNEFPDQFGENEEEVIDSDVKVEVNDIDEEQSCSEVYFIYIFALNLKNRLVFIDRFLLYLMKPMP